MARYIDPPRDIGDGLLGVEKPARYTGGEAGRLARKDAALQTVIAFPDVYEIGMSNYALKIIYNRLNALPGVSCDRAFAPAPDFEALIKEKAVPLYALDTGLVLHDADVLMFTIGYELSATALLAMLAAACIPPRSERRSERDPLVVAGGVGVSNPLPFSAFIDVFWIGEAEAGFFELIAEARALKERGADRAALAAHFRAHPAVWYAGKQPARPGGQAARRAVWAGFSRELSAAVYPIPSMRIVQQHGYVEIMRGCPNGCRFCHAGIWYRPMRQKDAALVVREVDAYVQKTGIREISLSSLSSADYNGIGLLIDKLHARYRGRSVSFQLPSLHISTFSLPLLERISRVRKSGLTFAVETAAERRQLAINKTISLEKITGILIEAKKRGWKSAKFYFMLGLPPPQPLEGVCEENEADGIIWFIKELAKRTRMTFNVNIGFFIPKPHTPYQWSAQDERCGEAFNAIRAALKPAGHKVSGSDSLVARIEGLISRGDERVGAVIEEAFNAGCRLDAWSEHFKRAVWEELLLKYAPLVTETLGAKEPGGSLPWDCVASNTSERVLLAEWRKSNSCELSSACQEKCTEPCGVCDKAVCVIKNKQTDDISSELPAEDAVRIACEKGAGTRRMVFSYAKTGSAVFLPHLSLIEVFSTAFARAGIAAEYTQGFNPMPRLSFASPAALGLAAENEIASIDIDRPIAAEDFAAAMNAVLPEGLRVKNALCVAIASGEKKVAVPAILWGFVYRNPLSGGEDYVRHGDDRAYRGALLEKTSLLRLCRAAVLAQAGAGGLEYQDYFAYYAARYPPAQ